ncbi:MAG: sorbosone dehydrogenase family protein [Wenzhouxiangellaceae bacterium]
MRYLALGMLISLCSTQAWAALPLEQIQLPQGFVIEIYAEGVDNARQMAMGEQGTLFVGSRRAGKVHALVDSDSDGFAETVHLIASDLTMPSGVAFRDGALYVAAVDRILRYDNIEQQLTAPPAPVIVSNAFPSDTHHGWKYIDFGPDGKLYVPVGAPCNICDEPGYANIQRLNADGSGLEVYASGVRNSVGFDWHPRTGDLWFTDNGRDHLGDNRPPCELNHAPRSGMHFGYPYCHGDDISDPEYGDGHSCADYTPPAQSLGPHVAPLGMAFYTGNTFPQRYHNQIFIPEHGSWNRSDKIGYRITLVTLDDAANATDYQVFAEGWLQGQNEWGRPVDILVLDDGSMLVSDDKANVIYRIRYQG